MNGFGLWVCDAGHSLAPAPPQMIVGINCIEPYQYQLSAFGNTSPHQLFWHHNQESPLSH